MNNSPQANYNTNSTNFNDYRCNVDPGSKIMTDPWFRMLDTCPCVETNPTGRGITACPFGVQTTEYSGINTVTSPLYTVDYDRITGALIKKPETSLLPGSLYSANNYIPPQLDPRPFTRIGISYRY